MNSNAELYYTKITTDHKSDYIVSTQFFPKGADVEQGYMNIDLTDGKLYWRALSVTAQSLNNVATSTVRHTLQALTDKNPPKPEEHEASYTFRFTPDGEKPGVKVFSIHYTEKKQGTRLNVELQAPALPKVEILSTMTRLLRNSKRLRTATEQLRQLRDDLEATAAELQRLVDTRHKTDKAAQREVYAGAAEALNERKHRLQAVAGVPEAVELENELEEEEMQAESSPRRRREEESDEENVPTKERTHQP